MNPLRPLLLVSLAILSVPPGSFRIDTIHESCWRVYYVSDSESEGGSGSFVYRGKLIMHNIYIRDAHNTAGLITRNDVGVTGVQSVSVALVRKPYS